jgi:hypothetical protein
MAGANEGHDIGHNDEYGVDNDGNGPKVTIVAVCVNDKESVSINSCQCDRDSMEQSCEDLEDEELGVEEQPFLSHVVEVLNIFLDRPDDLGWGIVHH